MKKRLKIIIPVAVVLIIGAILWHFLKGDNFTYAGTVEATEVDMPAQVSSTISQLKVAEGQAVTQGQLLVTLDGTDYKLTQSQATDDYNRGLQLLNSGSMPKETFNHLQSQKQLADLRVQWCSITSPLSGTVLTKYHEPGEWVNPGTKVFTLADLRQVWCLIFIPEPKLVQAFLRGGAEGHPAGAAGKDLRGDHHPYQRPGRVHPQERADRKGTHQLGLRGQGDLRQPGRAPETGHDARGFDYRKNKELNHRAPGGHRVRRNPFRESGLNLNCDCVMKF